ncbi:Six-hairpin glycosidase-like protein [Gongronella butleri]|nr:Six-hairpin glycosidase-like protein [Gongronella butleri]
MYKRRGLQASNGRENQQNNLKMHFASLTIVSTLALAVVQASPLLHKRATCTAIDDALRMDCGTVASSESSCTSAGCCWSATSDGSPWCYYPTPINTTRPAAPDQATVKSWLDSQYTYSVAQLLKALSPSGTKTGCVVAAQSSSNPDYWYHWARDSALTMDVIARLYAQAVASGNTADQALYKQKMLDWISFEQYLQGNTNPTVSITGNILDNVGEPKFNVDGSAFTGGWGRPQNDGPGLRIHALVRFTGAYVTATGDTTFAKSLSTMITRDMNYIIRNYNNACTSGTPCVDLWEERSAQHWYTQMAQRRGLIDGAYYMKTWGNDASLASSATSVVAALEPMIEGHWNSTLGYFKEMSGISDRNSVDAAIMLGSNQLLDSDYYLSPSTDTVLASVFRYARNFKGKFIVNQNRQAYAPAVGRYLEDVYNGGDGVNNDGAGPWLLATAGMAEFYYHAATEFWQNGGAVVTSNNKDIFAYFGVTANVGDSVTGANLKTLVTNMAGEGDAYLSTLQHFMGSNQEMTEQFNPKTGVLQGAAHLTWSYAALITSSWARSTCYSALAGNSTTTPTTTASTATSTSTTTTSAGGSTSTSPTSTTGTATTTTTTTSATATATASSCAVANSVRADCGYVGITQSICQSRNCCWSPTSDGTPWCFYAVPSTTTCAVSEASRADCGYVGITQSICQSRNCCWSPTTDGNPWCFHALTL